MEINSLLLTNFKAGKIDMFYSNIYPSLLSYAIRILNPDYSFLAEDCVQDAIFKAYNRRNSFTSPFHFKSFIYSCIHNNAVSVLRKNKSRCDYISQQDNIVEDLSRNIIEQETLSILYEAIEKLPENLRKIFELSFEQGLKNAEVAATLDISESAVKKKKAKMISIIKESLADNNGAQLLLLGILISNQ